MRAGIDLRELVFPDIAEPPHDAGRFERRDRLFELAVEPAAAAEVIRLCAEANLDLAFAQSLITAKATAADLPTRIAAERESRATAKQRADFITEACRLANVPSLACTLTT